MSSTPTPPLPPTPQPAAAAPAAASQTPQQSFSLRRWLQDLPPIVKGAVLVVLIALAVGWYIFNGRVTTDDAQVDCHITAVAPQVPGYVVDLLINDNTAVKAGDLLVQVDPREYEAEVAQAKANLEFAEAQANSAQIQIGLTRATTAHSTSGAAH
ncbi:MAG TPA: biotin/lipoyl-binding protein, partial [Candidatus Acidoferrales bacterium]|nr:biotin/lipoyl-binding protein [Candidatus Acidoferrales bacterium]